MNYHKRTAFKYKSGLAGLLVALCLSLGMAACGDPTATTAPASATVAPTATTAPSSPTTVAATATPVVLATPLPTITAAPTTVAPTATPVPATTAPASTTQPASTVANQPATTPAVATKITQGQPGVFSAETAYNHVKALANDIGIRPAGSENQKKAGTYIAKQFEGSGLKVNFQESSYGWLRNNGSTMTVSGDSNAKPLKLRLFYTDSSQPADTEAELALVDKNGVTDPAAFAGKVALVDVSNSNLNQIMQKFANSPAGSRPLAVLIVPDEPEPLLPPAMRKATISVAYTEEAPGKELLKQAAQGPLKVKLSLKWEQTDITIRNVIGTRPATGNAKDAPVVIIGGHYDSVPEGPGANDNGSGTGIILELARTLAKAYPEVEFRFIAFDGEELGLIGSAYYVKQLSNDEKSRILGMINIDMVAVGKSMAVSGSKTLAGLAKGVALDLGLRDVNIQATEQAGGGSDHASFAQAKIPFLSFDRFSDPNYHRVTDTPDKFTPQPLNDVAQITLGTLQRFLLSQG